MLRYFYPEAVISSQSIVWDLIIKAVSSPDNKAFQQCIDGDEEYDFVAIDANNSNSLSEGLNKHLPGISSYISGQDSAPSFHLPKDQSISGSTLALD